MSAKYHAPGMNHAPGRAAEKLRRIQPMRAAAAGRPDRRAGELSEGITKGTRLGMGGAGDSLGAMPWRPLRRSGQLMRRRRGGWPGMVGGARWTQGGTGLPS